MGVQCQRGACCHEQNSLPGKWEGQGNGVLMINAVKLKG